MNDFDTWIEKLATKEINERRRENGLEAISPEVLREAGFPRFTAMGIIYTRDGWEAELELGRLGLVIRPPKEFNYKQPRMPFTGELWDEYGPVWKCNHDWEHHDGFRQCAKCQLGEETTKYTTDSSSE